MNWGNATAKPNGVVVANLFTEQEMHTKSSSMSRIKAENR